MVKTMVLSEAVIGGSNTGKSQQESQLVPGQSVLVSKDSSPLGGV